MELDYQWEELYDGRTTATRAMVTGMSAPSKNYFAGWHLCPVSYSCIFAGYHMAGEDIPEALDIRLWIQRADPRTGLPTGIPVRGSDIIRQINSADPKFARDTSKHVSIASGGTLTDLEYVDLVIASPILLTPGLYWIGIARADFIGSEKYVGSWVYGHTKGLRDLLCTESFVTLDEFEPQVLTALNRSNSLKDQVFHFLSSDPSELDLCNIDISLILEKR